MDCTGGDKALWVLGRHWMLFSEGGYVLSQSYTLP